ncbi:MAG: YIP1 family protein [Candidatus Kariarchaeaceae archaeon]
MPLEYVLCIWCGFDLTAEHIRRSGIQIGRKEAFGRMKKVIINPLQAFKEISLIPDLNGARWIFYLIGVAMTLNMLAIFSKINGLAFNLDIANAWEYFGSTARVENNDPLIGISVSFLVGIAFLIVQPIVLLLIFNVVWKIGARLIAGLSRSFGGTGDRVKIKAAIAYSLVPVLLAWSAAWLIRLVTPKVNISDYSDECSDVSGDSVVNIDGDRSCYSSIEKAIIEVSQTGFGGIGRYLIIIGWIWATVLGIIGISRATRISIVESVIVAGIPYLLFMTIVT